jgi:hypothetical protein
MPETLGWGAGGIQAFKHDQAVEAQTRMNEVALGIEQQKLEAAEAEAGVRGNAPEDMSRADTMNLMGDMYMAAGAPKRAMDAYEAASKLSENENQARSASMQERKRAAELELVQSDIVYSALTRATDQASWDAEVERLAAHPAMDPDDIEGLRNMPFNEQTRRILADASMTAKDRATLLLTEEENAFEEDVALSNLADRQRRTVIAQRTLEDRQRRTAAIEKAGGSGASAEAPSSAELETVDSVLINEIYEGRKYDDLDDDEAVMFDVARQDIASRAKQIVIEDKSVTWTQAVHRAVTEARADGSIYVLPEWGADEVGYEAKGQTPDVPLNVPMVSGKVDSSALVVGKYYRGGNGQTARWDGENFVQD